MQYRQVFLPVCIVSNRLNEPHRVVCCEVLNLPSQDGVRPGGSALALAYRVTFVRLDPLLLVLAQNAKAATRAQQGNYLIPQKKSHE